MECMTPLDDIERRELVQSILQLSQLLRREEGMDEEYSRLAVGLRLQADATIRRIGEGKREEVLALVREHERFTSFVRTYVFELLGSHFDPRKNR